MTVTPAVLFNDKFAENTQTTQYTSSNSVTLIDKFTAVNKSAGVVTISVNIVPKSGTAGDSNLIIKDKSIAVNETFTFPELVGHVMAEGDFISTIASAATSLTIRASGRVIT